jgi:hypothetical protein
MPQPSPGSHVTVDGVISSYDNALLETFFTDDAFVGWVCRALYGD